IGRILERTDNEILIKTAGSIVPVPKNRIADAATTVQVRALDVFTREELYNQQILASPPSDADGNFRLAQYCERISDFAHAIEHYKKAGDLDPNFRTPDVKAGIAR